ncbi:MAG: MFS transporter [Thermoplasmata archaeon]|nr:MFS transporter [Thermoplasmata archaeon]
MLFAVPTSTSGRKRQGKVNLYVLSTLSFLISLGFGLIAPFLPFYAEFLGADAIAIGILLSSFMITRALLATPFGNLSDRIGRKGIIGTGAVMYAFLAFFFTLPGDWVGLIFVRAFQGVASAMVWPVGEALLVDSVPGRQRGRAMGVYIFASNSGWVLGPLIGGLLLFMGQNVLGLDTLSSYRFPFYVLAILSLIAAGLFFATVEDVIKPEKHKKEHGSSRTKRKVVLDSRTSSELRILYLNALVNGFSMGILSFITILFMKDIINVEEYLIGIIIGLTGAIGMIANIPAGRQADKVGRKPVLLLGGYLARFSMLVLPFVGLLPLRALGRANSFADPYLYGLVAISGVLAFRFFAFQISQPALRALQADIIPAAVRGRLIGMMQTMFNVGAIIGAPIGGAIYMAFEGRFFGIPPFVLPGEGVPFIISAILGFITLTLILLYVREPIKARKAKISEK